MPLHPEKAYGFRKLETSNAFYLAKEDVAQIKKGKVYRLMHLFNFIKEKGKFKLHSKDLKPELKAKLIHWLPADSKQIRKISVKMPDGKTLKGYSEQAINKVKIGEVIQFERFGFCCKQKDAFWFAHK